MNKLIKILVGLSIALLSACSSNTIDTTKHSIGILVDNTEKCEKNRDYILSSKGIIHLMGKGSGTVEWIPINAVSINKNVVIELDEPQEGETRYQERSRIKRFTDKVETSCKEFLGPCSGTKGSSIYKPFCESLQKLVKVDADEKTLIIVSDMIENSEFSNFYKDKPFDEVEKELNASGVSIPTGASDIQVIILYDPEGDSDKERKFDRAMEIWKELFKRAHITYKIKANM